MISRTACVTAATAATAHTKTLGFLFLILILFLVVVVVVVLLLVATLPRCFALPLHNERLQAFGGGQVCTG